MSDLRERTIHLAHEKPELRPHLLPILKEAGFGKTAGYTHYWTYLNRSESVNLNIDRKLQSQIMKALGVANKMVKQGKELKQMASSRVRSGVNPLYVPRDVNFEQLDYAIGERASYGTPAFVKWLSSMAENFATWGEEMERVAEQELARKCKTLAKNLDKTAKQMLKAYEQWDKHYRAYKPNQVSQANGYAKYADLADMALKAMMLIINLLLPMDTGKEEEELGFTDDEWKKILAGAKKIIAAFEKDPEPWGTAGEYHNYDYAKYQKYLEEHPGDYMGAQEAHKDPSPTGPFKIMGPMGTGSPKLDNKQIALNGNEKSPAGDLSHESFILWKNPPKDSWDFCKTARKPYDAVVVSILALAKKVAPKAISISSDGGRAALKKLY